MMGTRRNIGSAHIDIIRDGVREGQSVWSALTSTAASAIQAGWDLPEWSSLILDDPRSRLGQQARVERGRPIPPLRVQHRLNAAWAAAEQWLAIRPAARNRDDIHAHIDFVRRWIATTDLPDTWRRVLNAACDAAERYNTLRPALPWRAVAGASGLTQRQVQTAYRQLDDAGLLRLAQRGYPGARRRRASLYTLPTTEAMVSHRSERERPIGLSEEPRVSHRPSTRHRSMGREDAAATAIVPIATLLPVLDATARNGAGAVDPLPLPDNVIPLRPRHQP
jgi:hypothetical protein